MRVAVVGAGAAGLAAAHRLAKLGHHCDVYERWPSLGGQAATVDIGGRRVERFPQYARAGPESQRLTELFDELGMPGELEWHTSSLALFAAGASYPMASPRDLLGYRPLSLRARVRAAVVLLGLGRDAGTAGQYENVTVRAWLERRMGAELWTGLFEPLLRRRFGGHADAVSMAWLWTELQPRAGQRAAERRGYPRGSWEALWARLAELIEEAGGRVMLDRPVARIARGAKGFALTIAAPGSFRAGSDPRAFEALPQARDYDAVLATVPSEIFERMLEPGLASALAPGYRERLSAVDHQAASCLLLELDRPLTRHCRTLALDPGLPFVGVFEHTNFVDPDRYDGRCLAWIPQLVAPGDPLLALDADALLDRHEPALMQLNRAFSRRWVRNAWATREQFAQPILAPGHRERMPPADTGVPGLVLVNSSQVHPHDRSIGHAIALAEQAAQRVVADSDEGPRPSISKRPG